MSLRRDLIASVVGAILFAGLWSWNEVSSSSPSITTVLVLAAIMFMPILGLRLIVRVGGRLLREERERNRRVGI